MQVEPARLEEVPRFAVVGRALHAAVSFAPCAMIAPWYWMFPGNSFTERMFWNTLTWGVRDLGKEMGNKGKLGIGKMNFHFLFAVHY
jgi:hypothetical protein